MRVFYAWRQVLSCVLTACTCGIGDIAGEMAQSEFFDLNQHSHRRYNPLTNAWILCSPHRANRPWQGLHDFLGAPA